MFNVQVSDNVLLKIVRLENYLLDELKLSETAALQRVERIHQFLKSMSPVLRYPICRFKEWCELGYRCAAFEKSWIFAYEEFDEGIIIRDMSNTALLKDVVE
jgi:hypothetical protein